MAETENGKGLNLQPVLNSAMSTGSPKGLYVYFLLELCRGFCEEMRQLDRSTGSEKSVSNATLALIAFCPDKTKRKELLRLFVDLADTPTKEARDWALSEYGYAPKNKQTAAVLVVGELIDYLGEVLELTEVESGAMV